MNARNQHEEIDALMAEGYLAHIRGQRRKAASCYKLALALADPDDAGLTSRMVLLFSLLGDLYADCSFAEAEAFYRYAFVLYEKAPGQVSAIDASIILKRIADMCRIQSKDELAGKFTLMSEQLSAPIRKNLETLYRRRNQKNHSSGQKSH